MACVDSPHESVEYSVSLGLNQNIWGTKCGEVSTPCSIKMTLHTCPIIMYVPRA